MAEKSSPWTIDKRVPVALIAAVIMQTCGLVWWVSDVNSRVVTLERRVAEIYADGSPPLQVRIARLEEQSISVHASLLRIEMLLRERVNDSP